MTTTRNSHTATLLPNGQVLAAGGNSDASAELYDPATGLWTATGTMTAVRFHHTATLLPNGKVLVAGGYGPGVSLSSAELYDPATGVWTATGSMGTTRGGHTATLLPNGQVLVAGGNMGFPTYFASAELYNPATGRWTATGRMTAARSGHTATLLPNGKVLAAGGLDTPYLVIAGADVYDPATGVWTATGSMSIGRWTHQASILPNGQVLVAGGYFSESYLVSAELYDPATELWTTTDSMAVARTLFTATLLPSGQVLVAGGVGPAVTSSAQLYTATTGLWSLTDHMTTTRFNHTATLLPNGQVLVAGGVGGIGSEDLATAELYQPPGGALTLAGAASVKGGFAIQLPLTGPSGVEDRSGGPEKAYTVAMAFNQDIVSVGGASSTCGDVGSIAIDPSDPHTVNINLVNVGRGCNGSTINVTADSVTDDQGNVLASVSVSLGLLLGDVNGDRVVDGQDINLARQFTHERADSTNFRADVSNDGFIYSSDKRLIHQQLGTSLP